MPRHPGPVEALHAGAGPGARFGGRGEGGEAGRLGEGGGGGFWLRRGGGGVNEVSVCRGNLEHVSFPPSWWFG